MPFELFDPAAEFRITAGNLPHWFQPGVTYFITFRTDDSFPVDVARNWYRRRDIWLHTHGLDPRAKNWAREFRQLPSAAQREFHSTFSHEFMGHIDKGHGECPLRNSELARLVADALHHFDGQRYHLGDYVVMPNHVHVLVCLLGETDIEGLCYSWKKYSAREINKALGLSGRFWHEESFDHLVRTPKQFEALRSYIADNPKKAGLQAGEYVCWQREKT